jgi:hypothetical protein
LLRAQPVSAGPHRRQSVYMCVLCLTWADEIKHLGLTYRATQWQQLERQVPRAQQLKVVTNRNQVRNTPVNGRNGLFR